MHLRIFVFALVFCLVLSFAGCRNGLSDNESNFIVSRNSSISGTISQSANPSVRANGLPAAHAKVWLEQRPDLFAFTDAAGRYLISGIPAGVFKVVVRFSQGTTVFKVRSISTTINPNENKNCDLVAVEAKNKVKGTLKNEDGSDLPPGTKLYLWGEEFTVQEDGSFETPPLPDFQNIEDAINEIIVNFGLPSQVRLPVTFGSGGQTQKVEFFVPATPDRVELLPRVSLINVSVKPNEDGVLPNTNSTVRAIFFPENPEKIEWVASKGSLGQNINVSSTQIERVWTAPENAGLATITVSVTNEGKTVNAALPILIKGTPKYSVTYFGNDNTGGEVPVDNAVYLEGATVTVKENSLEKTGFSFVGWNTKSDGSGTDYAADATFKMPAANVELFAKWSAQATYKVTYNGNGNTGGEVPADTNNYLENTDVTAKQNSGNLVKTGFSFVGWNTKSDGSGTDYAADATFKMPAANVELFAKWSAQATYKVTYNGNGNTGGEVPADTNNYLENTDVTAKQNSGNLVKTGFSFVGWNTKSDGSGTDYVADATFKMPAANVELFAKWSAQATYKVTYSGNGNTGGDVPADTNNYLENADVTAKQNSGNLVKTGFSFVGWNTKSDGSGTDYAADATFKMPAANVELFAKWSTQATYKVTYNGNGNTGGDVPADTNNYLENADVTAKQNSGNLVKTGFTFAGWNTKSDGSGTDYAADAIFKMPAANVELFAKWSAQATYKVTYNGNGNTGGDVPADTNNYLENADVTAKQNSGNLVKTGFAFIGWNTKDDASGTDYAADATFKMPAANVELFAKWAQMKCTVSFDKNGGTTEASPTARLVVYGENVGTLPTAPTRTGYSFKSWNSKSDGTGTAFEASTAVIATQTVFSIWEINKFNLVYQAGSNGSITGSSSQVISYDSDGTAVTATPASGYKFISWSDGKTEASRTDTNITSDKILTASFAAISAEVNSSNKYAWSENAGWISFSNTSGKVSAKLGENGYLTGFAWSENVGWIKFAHDSSVVPYANTSATNWGVNVAADGKLSGYAWSENAGWIKFGTSHSEIAINLENGEISGYAWSENLGWISLSGSNYKVQFDL